MNFGLLGKVQWHHHHHLRQQLAQRFITLKLHRLTTSTSWGYTQEIPSACLQTAENQTKPTPGNVNWPLKCQVTLIVDILWNFFLVIEGTS